MIKTASVKKARSYATYIISQTVLDIVGKNDVDYDNIISFEKNSEGKILALKTNAALINNLKSEISSGIYKKLSNTEPEELSFSLGSVFNNGLLMGKGPEIKVKISPVGAIASDFVNEFKSSGINQTVHRIMIKINITFAVLMPLSNVYESVETSVCVAETVIVGEVPSAYTNVQNLGDYDGLDLTGDIVDFGAHDINENNYKSDG